VDVFLFSGVYEGRISGVRTCPCSVACTKKLISGVWMCSCSLACMKENVSGV